MKRIIKLTENDLVKIVNRVIKEQSTVAPTETDIQLMYACGRNDFNTIKKIKNLSDASSRDNLYTICNQLKSKYGKQFDYYGAGYVEGKSKIDPTKYDGSKPKPEPEQLLPYDKTKLSKKYIEDLTNTNIDNTSVSYFNPITKRQESTQKTYITDEKIRQLDSHFQQKYKSNSSLANIDPQLIVQFLSMLVELIPGLGTVASSIIDMANSIIYFAKFYITSDILNKVGYFILGSLGIISSFVPGGGNAFMIKLTGILKTITKWYRGVEEKIINSVSQKVVGAAFKEFLKTGGIKAVLGVFLKKIFEYFNSLSFKFIRQKVGGALNGIIEYISKFDNFWIVRKIIFLMTTAKDILDGTLYNVETYAEELEKISKYAPSLN